MANFDNIKHKIRKNWEDSQKNQSDIKDVHSIAILKSGQVNQLKLTNSIFRGYDTTYTEWIPMAPAWVDLSDDSVTQKLVNWIVTTNVPENGIGLVRFEVQYRLLDTGDPFGSGNLVSYQHFIQVDDFSDDLKAVTWYIGWTIQLDDDTVPDFETRLVFSVPNTNQFI